MAALPGVATVGAAAPVIAVRRRSDADRPMWLPRPGPGRARDPQAARGPQL